MVLAVGEAASKIRRGRPLLGEATQLGGEATGDQTEHATMTEGENNSDILYTRPFSPGKCSRKVSVFCICEDGCICVCLRMKFK